MTRRCQVVIVGGGPVGMGLAVELGRRGISCAVVERRLEPQRIPKGQNLTQRTLEHFYFWGIEPQLRAARLLPKGYPIGGVTAYRNLMSEYWIAPLPGPSSRAYYFQQNDRLPQYLTEAVLRERARDFPSVTTLFGWAASSFRETDSAVQVDITEAGGSGSEVIEADYLIGCDGARSAVRDFLGIDREGADFDERMVLAVFRSAELHQGLARLPERTTYRVLRPELKGYWQFFGRIDVGQGWFFHAPVPRSTTPTNYDFHGLIQQAAGFQFAAEFDHVGFWDLRIAVASSYGRGRVFIAGDAAHSHPPYGGFGLNSGFEDAINLGWKLAAVLQGWGGERLLASYDQERRPIFEQTGEHMIAGGIAADREFLERCSPERNRQEFERAWKELEATAGSRQDMASSPLYEPHYEGSSVMLGPAGGACSIFGSYTFEARAGHHLPPRALSSGRNVFEQLGPDLTLLAFGVEDSQVARFSAAAAKLRVPLEVVRDDAGGERADYAARLILVRPDQYVVWAGQEAPEDAGRLLRTAVGLA